MSAQVLLLGHAQGTPPVSLGSSVRRGRKTKSRVLPKTRLLINMKRTTHATSPAGLPVRLGLPNPIVLCTYERTCRLSSVIAKLKLHGLPLVQTTHWFDNPCYYERLRELLVLSIKLVDLVVFL